MNKKYNFKICEKLNNIGNYHIIRDDKPVFRIIKKDPKIIPLPNTNNVSPITINTINTIVKTSVNPINLPPYFTLLIC